MLTKTKLEKLLETKKEENKGEDFYFHGDYHTIGLSELEDIVDMLEDGTEYEDLNEVIEKLQDNGSIAEYADSSTPIYYADIAKWFGDNWSAFVCGNPVFVAKYYDNYRVYDKYSGMAMSTISSKTIKRAIGLEQEVLLERAGSEEKLQQMFRVAHERCTKIN